MKHLIKWFIGALCMIASQGVFAQMPCAGGGFVDANMICQNSSYGPHPYGSHPEDSGGGSGGGNGGYVPPKVIHLPTSYGAVAWDGKTGTYGYSSKQASKRASKQAALADCGLKACKVLYTASNACISAAHGAVNGNGYFVAAGDANQRIAEQKAIAACEEKTDNCQIVMSECSLAGDIENAQR